MPTFKIILHEIEEEGRIECAHCVVLVEDGGGMEEKRTTTNAKNHFISSGVGCGWIINIVIA